MGCALGLPRPSLERKLPEGAQGQRHCNQTREIQPNGEFSPGHSQPEGCYHSPGVFLNFELTLTNKARNSRRGKHLATFAKITGSIRFPFSNFRHF